MQRGITCDEVWKACDALLLEGARPTIERVRQKVGRGSPNTVGPMLDTWFKGLGARLTGPSTFASPPQFPEPVLQAAKHLWDVASAQSRADFDERLQAGLDDAQRRAAAEWVRANEAAAQAQRAVTAGEGLRAELDQLRQDLEMQRRANAVAATRLDDEVRQVSELQQRLMQAEQHGQSALEEARRDLHAVQERSTVAEHRAAREIDAQRQARVKADRRVAELETMAQRQREDRHAQELLHAEQMTRVSAERDSLRGQLRAQFEQSRVLTAELTQARDCAAEHKAKAHALASELALAERILATLKPAPPKPSQHAKRRSPRQSG